MISRLLALTLAALLVGASPSPSPALNAAQRGALDRYITSLGSGHYTDAFRLLTADERRYFGNDVNFGSVFQADKLKIGRYRVVRVEDAGALGVLAVVSESVDFFDHAHQVSGTATARVAYGLVNERGGVRIKDPYHPWRAFDPTAASAEVDQLRVAVRKVSFFTGRVEFLITFENLGEGDVTLLPYGRSVLRDDGGTVYHLIETKLPSLTDRNLRLGLRLASSGQYTGALTFFTPDRFAPKSLALSIGRELRDGADAPFSVDLPAIAVPAQP